MPEFFGIAPGQTVQAEAARFAVSDDGERVWMNGKWLDLGDEHGVVVGTGAIRFIRPDGRELSLGSFPAWVARGKGKKPVVAAMFCVTQFRGGRVRVGDQEYVVKPAPRHTKTL